MKKQDGADITASEPTATETSEAAAAGLAFAA